MQHDELQDFYCFTCDAVDIAARIRSLAGSRVRDDAVVHTACRLAWNYGPTLFRVGYDGFPGPQDDDLLRAALAADEITHPHDYSIFSVITDTVRPTRSLPDDMAVVVDFVDPLIGHAEGNLIFVIRRTTRLRDRVALDDLDLMAEYYQAQKAMHSDVVRDFGGRGRWLLFAR